MTRLGALINGLRRFDLQLEQVVDVIWLSSLHSYKTAPPGPVQSQAQASVPSAPSPSSILEPPLQAPAVEPRQRLGDSAIPVFQPTTSVPSLPLVVPAAPGLPGSLQIARALRPLRRRVPSEFGGQLDEARTVQRIRVDGHEKPRINGEVHR